MKLRIASLVGLLFVLLFTTAILYQLIYPTSFQTSVTCVYRQPLRMESFSYTDEDIKRSFEKVMDLKLEDFPIKGIDHERRGQLIYPERCSCTVFKVKHQVRVPIKSLELK